MGRGNSGRGGGNTANTENGITALTVVTSDGTRLEFQKVNGKYYNVTDNNPEELPAGINFKTIASNAEKQGAKVEKLTPKDLEKKKKKHAAYRKEMDEFLNNQTARNRHADQVNKAYRNTKKASRIAKRR